jgi:hypothetical protein
LSIALKARSVDNCLTAAIDRSRRTIRENLLGLPEEPVAAAAHRLEIPPFVLALRLATTQDLGTRQQAQRRLEQLDAEAALVLGPGSRVHSWALSSALLTCRRFLALIPWTLRGIDERTAAIRRILDILPYDENFTAQYAIGIDIGDNWEREDPLIEYTLISLAKYGLDITLSPEERDVVEASASRGGPGGDAARKLLS